MELLVINFNCKYIRDAKFLALVHKHFQYFLEVQIPAWKKAPKQRREQTEGRLSVCEMRTFSASILAAGAGVANKSLQSWRSEVHHVVERRVEDWQCRVIYNV